MTIDHPRALGRIEAALGAGDDPLTKARGLMSLHRSWAEDALIPRAVRGVVARSWSRAGTGGQELTPLDAGQLRERRQESGELSALLPLFKERLLTLATQAGNQLVVSDAHGYVLWVLGPSSVRRRSDGIGFINGARWLEGDVGTNGIGAAMVERAPVQIFGPEHGREEQHGWVCTSAPVLNPDSGALMGAITLAGSYRTAHPHSLALVASVAAEAGREVQRENDRRMYRLQCATEIPERDYVLVDSQGMVASSRGFSPPPKIPVPATLGSDVLWLAGLGAVHARQVTGGWLLSRAEAETVLELSRRPFFRVLIHVGGGCTEVPLGQRHWQILELLARHPAGVDSMMLKELWPEGVSSVTVRAEISRLRSKLAGLIASRPYRLLVPVHAGN